MNTVGLIVTNAEYLDEPPLGAALTAYDQAHLKLYLRLLDAEADGATWRKSSSFSSASILQRTPTVQRKFMPPTSLARNG